MRYILVLLSLMVANVAQAIDCRENPDCVQMGYSTASDPNCKDDGYIFCPFDKTYKKCVNMNCEALGFTKTDKTSWCNKLIKCKSDTSFTLCQNLCEVGDVYYSDGTCGYAQDYDASSGKTPVGVVYYVTDDGRHGKVINLHDLGRASSNAEFNPQKPCDTTYKTFHWGVYGTDIPDLTNWICGGSDNSYLTVAKKGDHSNPFWSAGKEYTQIIAEAQNNNLLYPASATLAFYPPGVDQNDPKVGKGKWYLPTLGELMDLYGYNYTSGLGNCSSSTGATGTTKTKVNATLQALKSKSAGNAEELTNSYYWSSSEYSSGSSWKLYMNNGNRNYDGKSNINYVRASLAFQSI